MKKRYILEEIKRNVFSRKMLLLFFSIWIFMFIDNYDQMSGGLARLREKVHYLSLLESGMYATLLCVIIPMLVCIPYAMSFANERDSGFGNIIFTKMKYKEYIIVKYFINILCSAVVTFVPLVIWYFILILLTGTSSKDIGLEIFFCKGLLDSSPFLYGIMLILNTMFFSIGMATLCLGFSTIINNKVVAFLIPTCIYIFSGVVLSKISIMIDMTRVYAVWNRGSSSFWKLIIMQLFIFLSGTLLYFYGCRVNDNE